MIASLSFISHTESIWNQMYELSAIHVPFYTYQWHELYFAIVGKKEEPIIFHLPDHSMIAAFGKKGTIASFAGPEITDFSDIIGQENLKDSAWKEILPALTKLGIKTLQLTNIPASSASYTFFLEQSQKNNSISVVQRDTTPRINPLPASYDEYLNALSRKNRHELKRKERKFLREHSEVYVCTKKGKDADIDSILSLMRMDARKIGFLTPEHESFFRHLPSSFPNSFLTMILYVGKTPATGIVAFHTHTAFLLYNSGFDQTHFPGAGFYLKAQSIHYAISHNLKEYNFLRGGERYKYELGGVDFSVFDITVNNL